MWMDEKAGSRQQGWPAGMENRDGQQELTTGMEAGIDHRDGQLELTTGMEAGIDHRDRQKG